MELSPLPFEGAFNNLLFASMGLTHGPSCACVVFAVARGFADVLPHFKAIERMESSHDKAYESKLGHVRFLQGIITKTVTHLPRPCPEYTTLTMGRCVGLCNCLLPPFTGILLLYLQPLNSDVVLTAAQKHGDMQSLEPCNVSSCAVQSIVPCLDPSFKQFVESVKNPNC